MKKVLSVLLSLIMAVGVFGGLSSTAYAKDTINVKYFYHARFSRMVRVFVESSKRLNCYSLALKYINYLNVFIVINIIKNIFYFQKK